MKALEGIRILDLTHALAGPFCTYHLALLGADVIKIEKPGIGDDFRAFVREPGWAVGSAFAAVNGGKRSLTINLKSEEGRQIIRKLAAQSDVVVENQRPGALDELGLSLAQMRTDNPALITCSISGLGAGHERSHWPAYDHTIQAMSGMAWSGSETDIPSQGRGFSIDCFTGYLAHSAILSALVRKGSTGQGQHIDAAMLDATMVMMGVGLVRQMISGDRISATQPIVQDRPTVGPFKTKDGWIWLSGNFQNHWVSLCKVLSAEYLTQDSRFATNEARLQNKDQLRAELNALIAPHSAADLERRLMEEGAPASQVRTSRQTMELDWLEARGMFQTNQTPEGQEFKVMNAGFVTDQDGPSLERPLPALGQHNDEILLSLGYQTSDIARMRTQGIL